MTITGGEMLLDLLESQGIEQIFSSPGTEWAPVWEGLAKRSQQGNFKLKYINCRHENLAISMAQGYAETSGRMAAVLLHSGVGVLNGSLAIRNALFARTPVLIISGETYQHSLDNEAKPQGWHWLGLLSDIGGPSAMVNSYVKWSNTVKNRDSLIDLIQRGCQIARSPVPGPVFLTVSPELLVKNLSDRKITSCCKTNISLQISETDLTEAAHLLVNSRKPMILTEYAGKNPRTVSALVTLAESLSIPVFEFFPFFGNFPKAHPLYQGYDANAMLQESDIILVIGSALPWYPPAACLRDDVKIILLDEDSLHQNIPHWGYQIDLALTGNIEHGIKSLADRILKLSLNEILIKERWSYWQSRHQMMMRDWVNETLSDQNKKPIAARWFLQKVRELMPSNTIFVDETITHTRLVHRYLGNPDGYIRAPYGGLGIGFGEAIGVKIAYPERPVVLIIGDGAFNYNPALAGLGLCQEYKLPLLTMIVNNGGYIAMKSGHNALFPKGAAASTGQYYGVDISPSPDYVKIAQAFGAYAEKIEHPQDIETVLRRSLQALLQGQHVLLDVIMA